MTATDTLNRGETNTRVFVGSGFERLSFVTCRVFNYFQFYVY